MVNQVIIRAVLPPLGARATRPNVQDHGPNIDVAASGAEWSDILDNDDLCDVLLTLNSSLSDISDADQLAFVTLVKYNGFNAKAMLKKLVTNFHRYMVVGNNRGAITCDTLKSFQGAISACVLLVLSRGGNVERIGNRSTDEGREVIRQLVQMFDLKSTAAQAGSDGATLFRIAAMMPHVCAAAVFKNKELMQLPRTVCKNYNLPKAAAILVCPGAFSVFAEDEPIVLSWDGNDIPVRLDFVRPILYNLSAFVSGASTMFLARRMNKPIGPALERSIKGLAGAAAAGESPFCSALYFELMNNKMDGGEYPLLDLIKYENADDVTEVTYYLGLTRPAQDMYNEFKAAVLLSNDLTSLRTYPGWEDAGDFTSWDAYVEVQPYTNTNPSTVVLTPR